MQKNTVLMVNAERRKKIRERTSTSVHPLPGPNKFSINVQVNKNLLIFIYSRHPSLKRIPDQNNTPPPPHNGTKPHATNAYG